MRSPQARDFFEVLAAGLAERLVDAASELIEIDSRGRLCDVGEDGHEIDSASDWAGKSNTW